MGRLLKGGLTLCALLLVGLAGAVGAADVTKLHGDVEPRGKVRVQVDQFDRAGEVIPRYRVRFTGIPLQCGGGETETTKVGTALYRFDSDRDLDATVFTFDAGADEYRSKLAVRMRIGGNRRVDGTVRYLDRQFETAPGVAAVCDSGRLSWEAERREGR